MSDSNPGCELDLAWINEVRVNTGAVNREANELENLRCFQNEYKAAWLLKAITLIDLTTLAGDDTPGNVSRLCFKAARPVLPELLEKLGFNYEDDNYPIHTAAVCVYPAKVEAAVRTMYSAGMYDTIKIAAVATGFPSGQYSLKTRLDEIRFAVEEEATEIDIVIDRSLVITGQWALLYQEIQQMKEACGRATMKAILATGELINYTNVYKASLVAMMAGSDFIKTSTGKESVNATLQFGIVMSRAIKDYYKRVGYKVGLKPAGGIRTSNDALSWLVLVKERLGNEWLSPTLFRFGASGLLTDIEQTLYEYCMGEKANLSIFTMG